MLLRCAYAAQPQQDFIQNAQGLNIEFRRKANVLTKFPRGIGFFIFYYEESFLAVRISCKVPIVILNQVLYLLNCIKRQHI